MRAQRPGTHEDRKTLRPGNIIVSREQGETACFKAWWKALSSVGRRQAAARGMIREAPVPVVKVLTGERLSRGTYIPTHPPAREERPTGGRAEHRWRRDGHFPPSVGL